MASVQEHLKLKRVSIDDWSVRERLCLSSSVLRSGDQNWMSVSRSVKVFGEPNRPDDWFSQKNCAVQYSTMLEKAETPKRKKRSSSSDKDSPVETVGEIIMRKCTSERIDELQRIMEADKAAYLKLQRDVQLLQGGFVSNDQIALWAQEMDNDEKQKEIDAQNHALWLKEREAKKAQLERAWKPHMSTTAARRKLPTPLDSVAESGGQSDSFREEGGDTSEMFGNRDMRGDPTPKPTVASPTSPFLTSLLKNPSPTKNSPTTSSILHSAITSQRSSTPTITSLLSSSPGVPQARPTGQEEPVPAGVPTLSMLLQLPPGGGEKLMAGVDTTTSVETLHHPQHQQLQLSKESETDEILDVVDIVDQSLAEVEDMEPIEIGLEEIIADLEQAAASHENSVKELLRENIAMGDVPQTPTNVDTFHKIFDDFYAMNVVKPKDSEAEDVKPVESAVEIVEELPPKVDDAKASGEIVESAVRVVENVELKKAVDVGLIVSEISRPVEEEAAKPNTVDSASSVVQEVVTSGDVSLRLSEEHELLMDDVTDVVSKDVSDTIDESARAEVDAIVDSFDVGSVDAVRETEKEKTAPPPPAAEKEEEKPVEIVKVVTEVAKIEVKPSPKVESPRKYPDKFDDMVNEKPPKKKEDKVDNKIKEAVDKKEQPTPPPPPPPPPYEAEIDFSSTSAVKVPDVTDELKDTPSVESDMASSDDNTRREERDDSEDDKNVEMAKVAEPARDECTTQGEDKDVEADSKNNAGMLSGLETSSQEKVVPNEAGTPRPEASGMEQTPGSRSRFIRRTATPAIDSLPGSPASATSDEEREYRAWKKAIMLVWNGLAAHKYASLFYKPITDDLAPEYSDRVRGQVDLSTIKRLVETAAIKTTAEFQRDVLRMFVNAAMYNKTNMEVYKMASEMMKDSLQQINDFVATQRLIQSPGDSASTRRETRTTDPNATNLYKRKRESDVAGKNAKKR